MFSHLDPTFRETFELRCEIRREVAEAIVLLSAEAHTWEVARTLTEQYLSSLDSASALEEVRTTARYLSRRTQVERSTSGPLPLSFWN